MTPLMPDNIRILPDWRLVAIVDDTMPPRDPNDDDDQEEEEDEDEDEERNDEPRSSGNPNATNSPHLLGSM